MNSPRQPAPPVLVIAGPTASGKSALAVDAAEAFNGTVINADSMQVYRQLRILTARPSAADEARARLLDPAFIDSYADAIPGRPAAARGTTHISVLDGLGNAASWSLSNGEGSGFVLPGTGIMPNNMLGEADLNPQGFNRWQENCRIASMMAPSLVTWPDGGVAALGSGGSNRIRPAILQVLVNLLDFGLPLADAIGGPRVHAEAGRLDLEPGFEPSVVSRIGASVAEYEVWPAANLFFGGVHGVRAGRHGADACGVGDRRRAGAAVIVN